MTISNQVKETIELAQQLLKQEKKISSTFKSVLKILFTLIQLILDTLSSNSDKQTTNLRAENSRLQEELLLMRQRLFGKKSEAQSGEPVESNNPGSTISSESAIVIPISAHVRKKGTKSRGRNIDTDILPRYKKYHDLEHDQQTCQCCKNILEKIGQDVSEQLEVLPMLLYVIEHIRYKYSCRKCQTITMAPKISSPLPKSLAGGSLLAEVVTSKYQYHIPLYRQSKIFASYGADIPDNTLGNWVMQSGKQLMPLLLPLMWQAILEVNYLQVDETPVKVQNPNKKGYLWSYFSPYAGSNGLIVFEFSLTRGSIVAEDRLIDFVGLLQTDGYPGYNKLRKRKNIAGLGCLSHARRKFDEVLKITKKATNPNSIATELISRIKPLYALEEEMRELQLNFHSRKRLRQKQAWPILKTLLPWLKMQLRKTPPKSKIAEAIIYTLNQWTYIISYLRHGIAEIDTNWVENEIRPIAIGKKNWLFMNNENSGAISAFWYSLVASAIMNEINPRVYIHFLLSNMHNLRKKLMDPMLFLPHTVDKEQLQKFSADQNLWAKQVLNNS